MELYKKIESIRKELRIKKDGRNDFAKYNYFTPDSIIGAVNPLLEKYSIFAKFDLIYDKEKEMYVSLLKVKDYENGDSINFQFDIKLGIVKGANESQASGSTLTYAKRYSYMNAFDIVDNKDDLDSNETAQKNQKAEITEKKEKKEIQTIEDLQTFKTTKDLTAYFNLLSKEAQEKYKKQFSIRKIELMNEKSNKK